MSSEQNNVVKPHPILEDFYQDEQQRRQRVDEMFDASAGCYDTINSIMSFGSGVWYRRQALLRAGLQAGQKVLDVGAGTGVVSMLAQDIVGQSGQVVALDPSAGMLSVAKARGVRNTIQGLGEDIPFPDNSFDLVTMGYALRHVNDLKQLFSEYQRVLKPGGKILILEITRPANRIAAAILKLYLKIYIPTVTRVFLRSAQAQELMRYYWETIENCVPPATITQVMESIELAEVKWHRVLGIFSEYSGIKSTS